MGHQLSRSVVPELQIRICINKSEVNKPDLQNERVQVCMTGQQQLNEEIRKFVTTRRVINPINVTLTELQVSGGFRIDNITSERNFRHFRNVLNSKVFGNGYRRYNRQLQMLVIREVSSNHRHHLHCIIEQPQRMGFHKFSNLIEKVWKSTNFGYEKIHIEKPSSQEREDGWLSYIMKDRTKVNLSTSVDWINSSIFNH